MPVYIQQDATLHSLFYLETALHVSGGTITQHQERKQLYLRYVNKKVQLDATVCKHLFTAKSLYMFRASQHPSSGVLKTVTATSGIGHNSGTAASFQRGLIRPRWKEVAVPLL